MIQNSQPAGFPPDLRILIVEDEDAIATRYKSGLARLGIRDNHIVITSCVEEAQNALTYQSRPFEVMILDIMLPITSADLQKVRSVEIELKAIRNVIRMEETLRDGDDVTRRAIEDAYTKRPQLLEQIRNHRRREAATEMIQKAGTEQLAKWPPIIVVTAWGDEEIGQNICGVLGSHPHRYLVKPISIERMEATIRNLLATIPK